MAIQFNCPYCTASIRVPDTAAGKQGTCPKCATKLIVPKAGPAEEPTQTAKKPPIPKTSNAKPRTAAADTELPTGASPDEGIPNFETDSPGLGKEPSMARVVRKRAKRKGPNPIVPIALFSVVLIFIVFWMWKPSAVLDGKLKAGRLEDYQIPPGRVDKSAFELPADEVSIALNEMKSVPPSGVLVRDWFDLQFHPDNKGLKVVIRKTSATEVYRVNTSTSPALRQLIHNHGEELLDRQREEFRKAAKRFIEDQKTAQEKDQPLDMGPYRSSLGFNRLTGTTGFALVAKIGGRTYRAVHEDSNGDLYFLLPKNTDKFVLSGREFEDGITLIPGRVSVEVKGSKSDKTPEKSPESPEPEPPNPMESPETKTEPTDAG